MALPPTGLCAVGRIRLSHVLRSHSQLLMAVYVLKAAYGCAWLCLLTHDAGTVQSAAREQQAQQRFLKVVSQVSP